MWFLRADTRRLSVKIQFTRWFSEWFCLASPRCQDDFGSAGDPAPPHPLREVVRSNRDIKRLRAKVKKAGEDSIMRADGDGRKGRGGAGERNADGG